MNNIVVFDFDGTLTERDTLIEFLRSTHGVGFYPRFLLLLPVLVLYKLGFVRNDRAKVIVLSLFYKGWAIERFDKACQAFASTIKTRAKAIESLDEHLKRGHKVVVVSASPENWVRFWASSYGPIEVLATKLEVADGRLTGRLASPNCYGMQKVERLCAAIPQLITDRHSMILTVYGDSSGDKELLEFANQGYYKKF